MNLPRASVKYPVTTTVGVILAVLFGAISLYRIPVQMTPRSTGPSSRWKPNTRARRRSR